MGRAFSEQQMKQRLDSLPASLAKPSNSFPFDKVQNAFYYRYADQPSSLKPANLSFSSFINLVDSVNRSEHFLRFISEKPVREEILNALNSKLLPVS